MNASRALCEAAAAGNLGAIQRVLDRGADGADPNDLVPVQAPDGEEYETTALVAALENGHLKAAALLLDRGASPDKPNSWGNTPMMAAAGNGHAAVVGLLLERGADLHATSPQGDTAVHLACVGNRPGCVRAWRRWSGPAATRPPRQKLGRRASSWPRRRATQKCWIACGIWWRRGWVRLAGRRHNSDLLSPSPLCCTLSGAVNMLHPVLHPVLCEAVTADNLGELGRALDGGADPNALVPRKKADGREYETTALVRAAAEGQLEAAALLLDYAANPDKPDSIVVTPLMEAAANGHAAMVGLLVERGVDLHAANPDGWTAFHIACYFNCPGCVEALIRASCDTAARTKTGGLTGKQLAEHHGNTEVLDCLRDLVAARLGGASWEAALMICWRTLSCHIETPRTGWRVRSIVDSTAHGCRHEGGSGGCFGGGREGALRRSRGRQPCRAAAGSGWCGRPERVADSQES